MNNTFSLEQLSKTGSLDSDSIMRHYKLDLMAKFMEIKSLNPKLGHDQMAKELGCSSSTLQRFRKDLNMLSPYGIPPSNTNKRRQKISNTNLDNDSHRERDVNNFIRPEKKSQMKMLKALKVKAKIVEKADPYIRVLKLTVNF